MSTASFTTISSRAMALRTPERNDLTIRRTTPGQSLPLDDSGQIAPLCLLEAAGRATHQPSPSTAHPPPSRASRSCSRLEARLNGQALFKCARSKPQSLCEASEDFPLPVMEMILTRKTVFLKFFFKGGGALHQQLLPTRRNTSTPRMASRRSLRPGSAVQGVHKMLSHDARGPGAGECGGDFFDRYCRIFQLPTALDFPVAQVIDDWFSLRDQGNHELSAPDLFGAASSMSKTFFAFAR